MEEFHSEKFRLLYFDIKVLNNNHSSATLEDVKCLFDTGAGMTFVSESDLHRLGYNVEDSVETVTSILAGGIEVETPVILINRVNVLGKDFFKVKVKTLKGSIGGSLLGMDFISFMNVEIGNSNGKFTSYKIEMVEQHGDLPRNIQGEYRINVF